MATTNGQRIQSLKPDSWIAVNREDRETVGYLEPLTEDYGTVQPRTVLGHPAGEPTDFVDGEERLIDRGLSELAEKWAHKDQHGEETEDLTILELSPRGIVLVDYYAAKAALAEKKLVVEWPDTVQRLSLSEVSGSSSQ